MPVTAETIPAIQAKIRVSLGLVPCVNAIGGSHKMTADLSISDAKALMASISKSLGEAGF